MKRELGKTSLQDPPARLQNAGIDGASDNLPEGVVLSVPGSVLFQFFGKELQQRFVTGGRYGNTTNGSAGRRPGKR